MSSSNADRQRLAELDETDPLKALRLDFVLPEVIYLDGNSLGPLPRRAEQRVQQVLSQQWGQDLITSWNKHGWIDLPQQVGEKIAPLLGAEKGQVICCDSVSINLFKLLHCALALRPERSTIVSLGDNFPTDLYVCEGIVATTAGKRLVAVAGEDIEQAIDDSTAVLLLTQVNFRSGAALDIERLTRLAHERGALVIWDLAHSAGVLPLSLDEWQVDFAVGCGYKYLNGGPGAPAFIYAAHRHHQAMQQPLTGWMGHRAPFEFEPTYHAAAGMLQFLGGTPPVLSMASLDAALDVFAELDIKTLRQKSLALTEQFIALIDQSPALEDLSLLTPRDPLARGSQLAYRHPEAYGICQALIKRGIIGDFRAPDILRLGFSPLVLSFSELASVTDALIEIIESKQHLSPEMQRRQRVT